VGSFCLASKMFDGVVE